MPTIQIDLVEVKQRPDTDNVVFTARQGNKIVTREIDIGEFDTWNTFASWIINQEPQFVLLPDKEKSLSVEFHTETDPETGIDYRVLDNVTVLS